MAPKKADAEPSRVYKGVYRNCGLWRARVWDIDHEIYLGHFSEDWLAASAYDTAAIRLRGPEAARQDGLNFAMDRYKSLLALIMSKPLQEVVLELRQNGVQANPANPDKPLK